MKVALLSPKGPLYRHRGGVFKKSLRYQPLTLTTLAALAPGELDIEFTLYDEGIGDIPSDLDADLKIWVGSDPTPIQKQFNKKVSIYDVQKVLASHVLG